LHELNHLATSEPRMSGSTVLAGGLALAAAFASGLLVGKLLHERKRRGAAVLAAVSAADAANEAGDQGVTESAVHSDADALIAEQLSRNAQFLGKEGQEKVEGSFVIVVGAGGVGSHCAHFLARSGVKKIRVIDFDNVTLSSLNRHALAGREDVGTTKVDALARHIHRFAPFCEIESCPQMFTEETAAELLGGNPDYVVDCIDDRVTKASLIGYCLMHKLTLISSMAAGAKADPTRVHIANFRDVARDPLATRLRWNLKQLLKDKSQGDFETVEVVYSSEDPHMKLLDLDDAVAGEDPSSLGSVPNFRVRVMPVLGTMPAIFGMTMAARVITQLAKKPFHPVPIPAIKQTAGNKYRQKLNNQLAKLNAERKDNSGVKWDLKEIDQDDVAAVMGQFSQRCAITQVRMGKGPDFKLMLWRFDRPVTPNNLVLTSEKATVKLTELVTEGRLPTHTELGISQADFRHILHVQEGLKTRAQLVKEQTGLKELEKGFVMGATHMNKDHQEDCLTLVKAFGDLPDATTAKVLSIDRFKMVLECEAPSQDGKVIRQVQFPSPLVERKEMRTTLVTLTAQARSWLEKQVKPSA